MNKLTRAIKRIERDKAIKEAKRLEKNGLYGDYETIITWEHFLEALKKCCKGVSWKGSVQVYYEHGVIEISKTIKKLKDARLPKLQSVKKIVIRERGKNRVIVPIKMPDRMVQRVFCDYALVPMFKDYLIFDNGASTKGKGVQFARERLEYHLRNAIRKWHSDFYFLQFDFKGYFDSIPHKTCYNAIKDIFHDDRIVKIVMDIILSYKKNEILQIEDKNEKELQMVKLQNYELNGICLGSQISQVMALVVPNELDHYIKDKCGVKHYLRYMDDGIIFSDNKEFLLELYSGMKAVCEKLGLKFNEKKTRISHISCGFTFMKIKYNVIGCKLIKRLTRQGITRMRRKLRTFRRLVDNGEMNLDDVYNSMQSWLSHAKGAMSYTTQKNMLILYDQLFDGYRITNKYKNMVKNKVKGRNVPDEILQNDKWKQYCWCCYTA